MKLSALLSTQPFTRPVSSWIPISFLVLGFLGFLDSIYLTISHYSGSSVVCSVVHGCNEVLQSEYSVIFGIPLAVTGVVYYSLVVILAVAFLDGRNPLFLKLSTALVSMGFLASLWFIYLQAFVIHAFCLYCLGSAAISSLLFSLSLYIVVYYIYGDTKGLRED